jgi:putative lipase involved disintegration of autophagic bodies
LTNNHFQTGVRAQVLQITKDTIAKNPKINHISVTGHSLGGALAGKSLKQ